jgi:hypothetical protein
VATIKRKRVKIATWDEPREVYAYALGDFAARYEGRWILFHLPTGRSIDSRDKPANREHAFRSLGELASGAHPACPAIAKAVQGVAVINPAVPA